jgi:hypothetical protein
MSLLADLQKSLPLGRIIKQQRQMIQALREENELLKARLAFADARLRKVRDQEQITRVPYECI